MDEQKPTDEVAETVEESVWTPETTDREPDPQATPDPYATFQLPESAASADEFSFQLPEEPAAAAEPVAAPSVDAPPMPVLPPSVTPQVPVESTPGAQPVDAYAAPAASQPVDPYAATPNPYAQPVDPYAQPSAAAQPSANPYAQPQANPYAQASADPYAQPQANPYAQAEPNPYAQASAEPYGQAQANPYAQAQPAAQQTWAQPSTAPYGQPSAAPYGQPYAAPPARQLVPVAGEGFVPPGHGSMDPNSERSQASMAHWLELLVGLWAPLIILLTSGDKSKFVQRHAKESLNMMLSMYIYALVAGLLCIVLVGFLLLPVVLIYDIVSRIQAAMAANRGEDYHYKFTIPIIK